MKKLIFTKNKMIQQIMSYLDVSSLSSCEISAKKIVEDIKENSKIADVIEELSSQTTNFAGMDNEESIDVESLVQIENPTEKSYKNLDEKKKNIREMTLKRLLGHKDNDVMFEIEKEISYEAISNIGLDTVFNINEQDIAGKFIPGVGRISFSDDKTLKKHIEEELVAKLLRRGAYDNKREAQKAVREVLAAMEEDDPNEPSNDNGTNNIFWNSSY